MTEEQVPESGMPELHDCSRTLLIAQMPVALAYPHLQFVGIWSRDEHIHIIVGFNHHCVRLRSKGESLLGHMSYISHYHKLVSLDTDGVTYGLGGVVRHHEIPDLKAVHIIPASPLKHPGAFPDGRHSDETRLAQFGSRIHRSLEPLAV